MSTRKRKVARLIGAGVICLAVLGMTLKSWATPSTSFALAALGHAFFPSQATCFTPADFGRISNNGTCGTTGAWFVIDPPVTTVGYRSATVNGSSGINGTPSKVNAVVVNRAGGIVRQSFFKNLPGGIGGGPSTVELHSELLINAGDSLEFDVLLMPGASVNSVSY